MAVVADTMISPGHDRVRADFDVAAGSVAAAISLAREVLERTSRRAAPVRQRFVMQLQPERQPPPLAQLMTGGRGGEVKLKVYLSLLWMAVAAPYDVSLPGRVWAELIGLPDPAGRGAHRVNSALRMLVRSQLLEVEASPGLPSRFYLLEETGLGRKYSPPGERLAALKKANKDFTQHIYLQVPNTLWTNGWIACLNGPGLAMLLVLIAQAGKNKPEDLWFSPAVADARFGLSEETRKRGVDQLAELGLVTIGRRPVARTSFDTTRLRNTYTLQLDHLKREAPEIPSQGVTS